MVFGFLRGDFDSSPHLRFSRKSSDETLKSRFGAVMSKPQEKKDAIDITMRKRTVYLVLTVSLPMARGLNR